jgi:UDP-N-acetylmuramoyl-L-alanyl-D-glutamate--2,6-diaminopimelate ligase
VPPADHDDLQRQHRDQRRAGDRVEGGVVLELEVGEAADRDDDDQHGDRVAARAMGHERRLRTQEGRPQPPVADGGQHQLVGGEGERHAREHHLHLGHVAAHELLDDVAHASAATPPTPLVDCGAMTLRELLGEGPADVHVTGLAFDNRRVEPGTLFFCVPGFTRDGHDFAPDAIARGAPALVVQRPLGLGVPEVVVEDVRSAMAVAAARFFGDPTASLDVVGVTGTNGKTTTAFLVRALLEAAGRHCGLLGTVKSVIGGVDHPVVRTTPEAIDLQRTFRAMADAGDVACAMEISSHALELRRADGIHVAVAVFTNLTQDHLDFHPDMEAYFRAKRLLFASSLTRKRVANVDDPYGARLAEEFSGTVTFGLGDADFRAQDLVTAPSHTTFTAVTPEGSFPARIGLPGHFNVLNALGAWAAAASLGVSGEVIAEALAGAAPPPGRFEPVDEGQPFAVLVDYSHTPDSLDNALRAARALASGRVIAVFGAGGDRDRGKRPLMGAAAARWADVPIVTSDNPRSEDPDAIIADILAGIEDRAGVEVEADRRAAIGRAVELAGAGDVIVIAGKGHEQGQEFEGGRKEPFDDVTVAREALRAVRS